MWFVRSCNYVAVVLVLAGCTETIELSMAVRGSKEFCPANAPESAFMNRYVVQSYRPQNGRCCTYAETCGPLEVIEAHCFIGPSAYVSAVPLNSELRNAGLVLEDWDPERATCVRVIAIQDDTDPLLTTRTAYQSVTCDGWDALRQSIRICAQTSTPARGTELVDLDATACMTKRTMTPEGMDIETRVTACAR